MNWKKLGLAYRLNRDVPLPPQRAMVPTPFAVGQDVVRVYFTLCDNGNIGRVHFVDLDARDPRVIVGQSQRPVLDVGEPSAFDEHGVVVAQVLRTTDNRLLMYYSGYERCVSVPYRILVGVAESFDDGQTFQRIQRTPILERSSEEFFFRCAPFVMETDDGFRMWYVAGADWENVNGKSVPRYTLRHLHSPDGMVWGGVGQQCMELGRDEHGIGRPWVILENGVYRLFYSIRRISLAAYRLGYAESTDGITWNRMDQKLGLDVTPGSYDSYGMSYSALFEAHDVIYCLYNGNDFGKDGIALAKLGAT